MPKSSAFLACAFFPGSPAGQPRPSFNSKTKRAYQKRKTKSGNLTNAEAWSRTLREAAEQWTRNHEYEAPKWDVPLEVQLEFRMKRPRSHHTAGDRRRPVKPQFARQAHVTTSDLDNLVKLALDVLGPWRGTQPLMWEDDRGIVSIKANKRYVRSGETPGMRLAIQLAE